MSPVVNAVFISYCKACVVLRDYYFDKRIVQFLHKYGSGRKLNSFFRKQLVNLAFASRHSKLSQAPIAPRINLSFRCKEHRVVVSSHNLNNLVVFYYPLDWHWFWRKFNLLTIDRMFKSVKIVFKLVGIFFVGWYFCNINFWKFFELRTAFFVARIRVNINYFRILLC